MGRTYLFGIAGEGLVAWFLDDGVDGEGSGVSRVDHCLDIHNLIMQAIIIDAQDTPPAYC